MVGVHPATVAERHLTAIACHRVRWGAADASGMAATPPQRARPSPSARNQQAWPLTRIQQAAPSAWIQRAAPSPQIQQALRGEPSALLPASTCRIRSSMLAVPSDTTRLVYVAPYAIEPPHCCVAYLQAEHYYVICPSIPNSFFTFMTHTRSNPFRHDMGPIDSFMP